MSQTVRDLPGRPKRVLLTGATGFVGQAVLERLLRDESVVHLLIRAGRTTTAAERLDALLGKSAFDAWRREVGPAGVARARTRLHVIEADLANPLPPVPADLDLVIHSASTVSFDEPWDDALQANVLGPKHLYDALLQAGTDPAVVHIATAYVGTDRVDVSYEGPVEHAVEWRAEIDAARAYRATVESDAESTKADTPDADALLREAGRLRARELGWTDAYTMSKALGERVAEELWAGSGHRLTVLRPTIIESALERPAPGWIDGFKVADPLIAAFAKDRLVAFPGRPEAIIDIVPVDVVVDAIMAAAVIPPEEDEVRYLHVGTGVTNPVTLDEFRTHVEGYLRENPWKDRDGRTIRPRRWKFLSPGDIDAWAARRMLLLSRLGRTLNIVGGQRGTATRGRVESAVRNLGLLRAYVAIYQPYTCSRTTYDDTQTRRLAEQARSLGHEGVLDVTAIDWPHYIRSVHMPSLTRLAQAHRRSRPVSVDRPTAKARASRRHAVRTGAVAVNA